MSTLWTQMLGTEIRFHEVLGVSTRSIRAGRGDAVIFLHGTGSTAEAFSRNILPFSERFDVSAIDLLGHGMTGTIDGALSKDAFVRHVIAYMDAVGIDRAHFVGNSLGGWLSLWISLQHPDRVRKVVNVVGPHLAIPIGEEARARGRAATDELKRLTQRLIDDPTPPNLRARLAWVFHNPDRDLTDEFVELRWALYQRARNGRQISNIVGNPGTENLLSPERLAAVPHPTLFLWTEHNPTPADAAQTAVSYLARGAFELMKGCGHWPQWEDPPTFNRRVMGFLAAAE